MNIIDYFKGKKLDLPEPKLKTKGGTNIEKLQSLKSRGFNLFPPEDGKDNLSSEEINKKYNKIDMKYSKKYFLLGKKLLRANSKGKIYNKISNEIRRFYLPENIQKKLLNKYKPTKKYTKKYSWNDIHNDCLYFGGVISLEEEDKLGNHQIFVQDNQKLYKEGKSNQEKNYCQ